MSENTINHNNSDDIIGIEDVQDITAPDKILVLLKKNKYILDIINTVDDGWYYIGSNLIRNTVSLSAIGAALTESEEECEYILKLWVEDSVVYGELREDDTDIVHFNNKPLMTTDAVELVRENCRYKTIHGDRMTFLDLLLLPNTGVLLGMTTATRQPKHSRRVVSSVVGACVAKESSVMIGLPEDVGENDTPPKLKKTKIDMVNSHKHRKWAVPK